MSEHDSPEEIEREIEQTREEIDRTFTQLQQKLAPHALVDKALASANVKSALRSAGSGTAEVAASVGRMMSSNPLPVLLTAVGIAWLAISAKSPRSGERKRALTAYNPPGLPTTLHAEAAIPLRGRADPSRGPSYEHVDDPTLRPGVMSESDTARTGGAVRYAGGAGTLRDQLGDGESMEQTPLDTRTDAEVTEELKARASKHRDGRIKERAKGAAASVSGRLGRVSETVTQGVERMTGGMKGSGSGAYESTRDVYGSSRHVAGRATRAVRQVPAKMGSAYQSAGSFVQENPMISGAMAVAFGAVLALMLPPSRRERQLMGDASDEVKATVREGLEETVDRAKDVVRTAAEAAADAARKGVTKGSEAAAGQRPGEHPGTSDVNMSVGAAPASGEPAAQG